MNITVTPKTKTAHVVAINIPDNYKNIYACMYVVGRKTCINASPVGKFALSIIVPSLNVGTYGYKVYADNKVLGSGVITVAVASTGGGITLDQVKADSSIASAISLKHVSGSDNQDLSGLEPKQTGKSLSTNDLTDILKTAYDGAVTHAGGSHAPATAQANADITKEEIEAKLTGELTSHTHASSGGLTQAQILTRQL